MNLSPSVAQDKMYAIHFFKNIYSEYKINQDNG